MINKPKISVLCPSYNHEKYVGYFIQSVLNQTEQNFELIIVDDCSVDNNIGEIEKYTDQRIKLIKHSYNKGINASLNDAVAVASGEYFVFIASDDILKENHFEYSCKYLDENTDIDVLYCGLDVIDSDNKQLLVSDFKNVEVNQTREELLRKCFFDKNPLTSPGMVIRADAFRKIIPLSMSILQNQDYQIHIRLLMNGNLHIISERLVNYRLHSSVSSSSFSSHKRLILEEFPVMDSFCDISPELFAKVFAKELEQLKLPCLPELIPFLLGRFALLSNNPEKQNWGYKSVMKFIKSNDNFEKLHDLFGFDFKEFLSYTSLFSNQEYTLMLKYKKYRKLFNLSLFVSGLLLIILMLIVGYNIWGLG